MKTFDRRLLLFLIALGLVVAASGQGEEVVRLTDSGARNGQVAFSPDGSKIAFVSNRSGAWQLWVMAPDGSDVRQVTKLDTPLGGPSWMPDGQTLLFYARGDDGRFSIYRTMVDRGEPSLLFDDGYDDFRPVLSSDGKKLLFDRAGVVGAENHDIYVRHLETGEVRRLTRDPGYDSDARWSPDGTRIVFHSDRGGPEAYHTQIWSMSSDGTDLKPLTKGAAKSAYPAWSPDGRRIAYVSEVEGNRDVWIMDADGANPIRVTTHPGDDAEPVWTRDGDALVFPSDRFEGMERVKIDVATLLQRVVEVLSSERRCAASERARRSGG